MTKLPQPSSLALTLSMILVLGPFPAWGQTPTIRFATADGKFEITGKIVQFMVDGREIEPPRTIASNVNDTNLSIVIAREDGTQTAPVPLAKLSKETLEAIRASLKQPQAPASQDPGSTTEPTEEPADDSADAPTAPRKSPPAVKKPEKNPISTDTELFRNHSDRLEEIVSEYREAKKKPGNAQNNVEFQNAMSRDIRALRSKVGAGKKDAIFDFVLSYLESDLGVNKTGNLLSIAKSHEGHWYAWRAAIASTIRHQGVSRISNLLVQFKEELVDYCNKRLDEPETDKIANELDEAAKAIAWLQDTCRVILASGTTKHKTIERLASDDDLAAIVVKIDTFAKHRLEVAQKRTQDQAEREAARKAELTRLASDLTKQLTQWQKNYERIWVTGLSAFQNQQQTFQRAYREYEVASDQLSRARSELSSAKSARDSAKNDVDRETDPKQLAKAQAELTKQEARVATWEAQEQLANERSIQLHQFAEVEYAKLSQIYQQLAVFQNEAKNMAILFEHQFKEAILFDMALKQMWIDFTNKVKLLSSQFPAMPTLMIRGKNKLELQKEKELELYLSIRVDLGDFFKTLK